MKLENISLDRAYEVSTKGLYEDSEGRILVIKDDLQRWELPGGGLDHGEDIIEGLKRECFEELGVECEVLDKQPFRVWVGMTPKDVPRLILLYRIRPKSFEFKLSKESEEIIFITKDKINSLNFVPQLKQLKEIYD